MDIKERRPPPKKQKGQATSPRTLNGGVKDVASLSAWLGWPVKKVRADVERGRLPYRKHGGRIIFLQHEVETFLARLPGIDAATALKNMAARKGEETE